MLRAALDQRVAFVMQGNSSAVAAALVDALNKHNEREPAARALLLNYSAVDPALTNEKCSFWHFRFDAHADMRLAALTEVLRDDAAREEGLPDRPGLQLRPARAARGARDASAAQRPDVEIVGDELHPIGRVKDFLPYATKIKASGAQAVLTGNWGNDLTLLVKAAARGRRRRRASTPSTATRWARRRRSARPASARCWRWPSGTRTSARRRRDALLRRRSARASRSPRTTTCTRACR